MRFDLDNNNNTCEKIFKNEPRWFKTSEQWANSLHKGMSPKLNETNQIQIKMTTTSNIGRSVRAIKREKLLQHCRGKCTLGANRFVIIFGKGGRSFPTHCASKRGQGQMLNCSTSGGSSGGMWRENGHVHSCRCHNGADPPPDRVTRCCPDWRPCG